MERLRKLRWTVVAVAIGLWIALIFGPGHTINQMNFCSLYTNASSNARELHEAWKSLFSGW